MASRVIQDRSSLVISWKCLAQQSRKTQRTWEICLTPECYARVLGKEWRNFQKEGHFYKLLSHLTFWCGESRNFYFYTQRKEEKWGERLQRTSGRSVFPTLKLIQISISQIEVLKNKNIPWFWFIYFFKLQASF